MGSYWLAACQADGMGIIAIFVHADDVGAGGVVGQDCTLTCGRWQAGVHSLNTA